jgi:hypothetical protein
MKSGKIFIGRREEPASRLKEGFIPWGFSEVIMPTDRPEQRLEPLGSP